MLVVLTSNIKLLNTLLGLQSCSAKNPCLLCFIKLEELRKDRSISIGEGRAAQNFAAHLASILQVPSWNAQRNLAPFNGSVINNLLIPISFDRVMLPVLHIVIEVVKKIWDSMVKCIQALELRQCKEISMLKEAHKNLACHVSNLMEKRELLANEYKAAEKQRKDTYKLWIDAKADQPRLSLEIKELQQQYRAVLSRQKKLILQGNNTIVALLIHI